MAEQRIEYDEGDNHDLGRRPIEDVSPLVVGLKHSNKEKSPLGKYAGQAPRKE